MGWRGEVRRAVSMLACCPPLWPSLENGSLGRREGSSDGVELFFGHLNSYRDLNAISIL